MDAAEVIRVLDALDDAGIRAGGGGGWGVDALLGRETRRHRDLDLGIPTETVTAAVDVLAPLGYVVTLDQRPTRLVLHSARGLVDLHPITWDDPGGVSRRGSPERRSSTRPAAWRRRDPSAGDGSAAPRRSSSSRSTRGTSPPSMIGAT